MKVRLPSEAIGLEVLCERTVVNKLYTPSELDYFLDGLKRDFCEIPKKIEFEKYSILNYHFELSETNNKKVLADKDWTSVLNISEPLYKLALKRFSANCEDFLQKARDKIDFNFPVNIEILVALYRDVISEEVEIKDIDL